MRKLILVEITMISGGSGPSIDPGNAQVLKDIAIDAGIGAALTPASPWIGAGLGAVGSVIHGAIKVGQTVQIPFFSFMADLARQRSYKANL